MMENKIDKFEDLKIWQEGVSLSKELFILFKDYKNWVLRDQMLKSVLSIPSNIAEGFERDSNQEFIRFLRIAKASCGELRTQLIILNELHHFDHDLTDYIDRTKLISAMITKLIQYRLHVKTGSQLPDYQKP